MTTPVLQETCLGHESPDYRIQIPIACNRLYPARLLNTLGKRREGPDDCSSGFSTDETSQGDTAGNDESLAGREQEIA